jgi:hypothetical protein
MHLPFSAGTRTGPDGKSWTWMVGSPGAPQGAPGGGTDFRSGEAGEWWRRRGAAAGWVSRQKDPHGARRRPAEAADPGGPESRRDRGRSPRDGWSPPAPSSQGRPCRPPPGRQEGARGAGHPVGREEETPPDRRPQEAREPRPSRRNAATLPPGLPWRQYRRTGHPRGGGVWRSREDHGAGSAPPFRAGGRGEEAGPSQRVTARRGPGETASRADLQEDCPAGRRPVLDGIRNRGSPLGAGGEAAPGRAPSRFSVTPRGRSTSCPRPHAPGCGSGGDRAPDGR